MKVEFAPINIPLARRIQTAAVIQWLFSFLLLGNIFIILLLGNYWFLPVLYALWLYLDWETPQTGGRRSKWVRNWTIWKYFTDYFPIHLIKTSDLDPSQNYLFGFHPHGILVAGAFGNFCTEYTGFKELFPGLTPYLHILPFWFGCPFFRDYALSTGVVSASKKSVSHVLNNDRGGNVAVIVIGGAEESLDAHPGSLSLNILKRRGFIKMAGQCTTDRSGPQSELGCGVAGKQGIPESLYSDISCFHVSSSDHTGGDAVKCKSISCIEPYGR
uniref:2-acylglycerol O-acyltransferase 1 n=1 Tax=Chelonoidis abingdonii TaxID=106734 RepID=A0A8C0GMB1_CHEAB